MFGMIKALTELKSKAQSFTQVVIGTGLSGITLAMLSYFVAILNSSITNGNAAFYNLVNTVQSAFTTIGGFLIVVAVLGLLAMFFGIFGQLGGGGRRGG